jgi:hypothetical protein
MASVEVDGSGGWEGQPIPAGMAAALPRASMDKGLRPSQPMDGEHGGPPEVA